MIYQTNPMETKDKYYANVLKARTAIDNLICLNTRLFTDRTFNLSGLFKKHFHGIIDGAYSVLDKEDLEEALGHDVNFILKATKSGVYTAQNVKGMPFNYEYCTFQFLTENQDNCTGLTFPGIIGASSIEFGAYFIFTINKETGYAEGKIFIRKSPTEKLKFLSTFTVITDAVQTTYETIEGQTKEIKKFQTNPSWIRNTVAQIEQNVFRQFK